MKATVYNTERHRVVFLKFQLAETRWHLMPIKDLSSKDGQNDANEL